MNNPHVPKTFIRGLTILESIEQAGPQGISIPALAAQTSIHRTTIYRFIEVLVARHYIKKIEQTNRYVALRQHPTNQRFDLALLDQLKEVVKAISQQTGDSCFLIRREHSTSVCIYREIGSYPVQVLTVAPGHQQPLGVGAAGLALLAFLPDNEIRDILTQNKELLYSYGHMSISKMRSLIQSTQERGWAVVGDSAVPGVIGVGMPIFDAYGYPIFAVSVSSIATRMSPPKQHHTARIIRTELQRAGLSWEQA